MSGTEEAAGFYAVLLSGLLAAAVAWFWLDRKPPRLRLAALLMLGASSGLLLIAALGFADIGTFLSLPSPDLREGVYLLAGAGALAGLASVAALLYNTETDRPAPALQTCAFALFLMAPGVLFLSLAAWAALDLPLPLLKLSLPEGRAVTPFDSLVPATMAGIGLVAGLAIGFATSRPRLIALGTTVAVAFGLLALLILLGENEGLMLEAVRGSWYYEYPSGAIAFQINRNFYGMVAVVAGLGVWAGVGVAELSSVVGGPTRRRLQSALGS